MCMCSRRRPAGLIGTSGQLIGRLPLSTSVSKTKVIKGRLGGSCSCSCPKSRSSFAICHSRLVSVASLINTNVWPCNSSLGPVALLSTAFLPLSIIEIHERDLHCASAWPSTAFTPYDWVDPFFISFKTATTVLCNSVTVSRPLPFQLIRHPNPACEAVGTAVNVFFVHRLWWNAHKLLFKAALY